MDSDTCGGAGNGGLSLYPLQRCKTIHLVRHAQGIHNVEVEGGGHPKTSPQLLDAPLSPLGCTQVEKLREHVHSLGLLKRIQLVIVSPLLRTMQTAVGVFGNSPAVSPPFIAVELCRERMGVNTADKRRSVTHYQPLFPQIDFSLVESDKDTWWTPDVRESDEDLAARGIQFFNWLWTREEEEIAIVTHSAFLFHTLLRFGNDCHESVKTQIHEFFQNCELRSMVLVDSTRMEGTRPAKTDYPGGIRADHPSDAAAANGV